MVVFEEKPTTPSESKQRCLVKKSMKRTCFSSIKLWILDNFLNSGDKWFIISSIDIQFMLSFCHFSPYLHTNIEHEAKKKKPDLFISFDVRFDHIHYGGICYSSVSFPLAMSTKIAVRPTSTRAKLLRSY